MANSATGKLLGNIITLDDPLPSLDGKRVRVVLEPVEESEKTLTTEEQQHLWQEWVERGQQGQLEDEDEPGFP